MKSREKYEHEDMTKIIIKSSQMVGSDKNDASKRTTWSKFIFNKILIGCYQTISLMPETSSSQLGEHLRKLDPKGEYNQKFCQIVHKFL